MINESGRTLEIQKYRIQSTFEATISKQREFSSDTEAHVSGEFGLFTPPKVKFDITEKIKVNNKDDETSHNTFDVEIELGQSDAEFGYVEIVKAMVRTINKLMDLLLQKGFENPQLISEEEAKALEDKSGVAEDEKPDAEAGNQDN